MSYLFVHYKRFAAVVSLANVLLIVFLLASGASELRAQGVGSSRGLAGSSTGIHSIQGRVYDPNGKPITSRLKVRLETPMTGSITTVTDGDGNFNFGGLDYGEYNLVVEGGSEFENSSERAWIDRGLGSGARGVKLTVHMRANPLAHPAFASAPKPAIEAYKKGAEAARAGKTEKAVEHYEAALAAYPTLGPALTELGVQYLKLGQADKAAAKLEQAVKLSPEDFYPRLNYGIALLNQKKYPQAEEQLRIALSKNNSVPTAHMYLGLALMSQQKLDDAEKELLLAVRSNSNEVATAHRYLGGIYWGKRDYKRAADELETYLKLVPKAGDAERTKAAIKELRSKQ
jgi:tetratricopeptide (TPR) repeat protein